MRDLNRKLRQRIDLHARQILLQIAVPLEGPLAVKAGDDEHRVVIAVSPANLEAEPAEQRPGEWLSPLGRLLWNALPPGEWLVGKQIASRAGLPYEAKLKHILQDLEDRGVLLHEDGRGYARAVSGASGE